MSNEMERANFNQFLAIFRDEITAQTLEKKKANFFELRSISILAIRANR